MAPALRPLIFWLALSAALFFASGVTDGVYPGGRAWPPAPGNGAPWIAYPFGVIELLLAALIVRGRDWAFFAAVGIAAFFIVERPLAPLIVNYTTLAGYAVHFLTGVAQVFTMFTALRVFRILRGYLESAASG